MLKSNSTPIAAPGKPSKPYSTFPLTPHPAGYWCKKIRGKIHYFGKWADPDGALAEYLRVKDALHAGREPRPDPQVVTVKDVCNALLNHKQAALDAGELSPLTWRDYKDVCNLIVSHFGKLRLASDVGQEDFTKLRNNMANLWGPHRLAKTIQFVRCVFKYAYDAELLDRPIRFGPGFKRPSKKTLRLHRAKQGPKLFKRGEILRLLDAASVQLKAMILLGINCGFGNADCGMLPLSAVNLDAGLIDFPRPKTGILRRCPLWPETVAAIREAFSVRPEPKKAEHSGLVFLTRCGDCWRKDTPDGPVSREMGKLLNALGINGRKGLGFYTLRHTFRTMADESKDQPAVDFIMGHESPHMSSVYRETISDARLQTVVKVVRDWLFAKPDEPATRAPDQAASTSEKE
jgi:integrase